MLVSAGIVLVKYINNIPNFLLLRAYDFWDFPKGKREKGEELIQTALREVREETGISSEEVHFDWGFDNIETVARKSNGNIRKKSYYFVARVDNPTVYLPINPIIGEPEHQDWQWLKYDEVAERVCERVKGALDWAKEKIT